MAIDAEKYYINDKSAELISLYNNISGENRKAFFSVLEEIVHNWNQLTRIVEKNHDFFISVYKDFSQDKTSEEELQQDLLKFITEHAGQLEEMFSGTFNFNATNFLKELEINSFRKIKRMRKLEKQKHTLPDTDIVNNVETSFKSAFYMHFRHIYNYAEEYKVEESVKSAVFFFIRNFAYSGMFRYNASGHFNVPYGGIGYNRKNLQKKIDYLESEPLQKHLQATKIENLDFEIFLKTNNPGNQDFIFLDPPYDSEFSTYAKNEFTKKDQKRLADYLIKKCKAQWMLIIKNTDFISELYCNKGLNIKQFDKAYLVSFMNRNDKNVEHLLITNY